MRTDPLFVDVLFEARIKLSRDEITAAEGNLQQAVQNAIGQAGAAVTCVFEES